MIHQRTQDICSDSDNKTKQFIDQIENKCADVPFSHDQNGQGNPANELESRGTQ